MEHCRFCGTALPNFAHFCGHCGAPNNRTSDTPTNMSGVPVVHATPPMSAGQGTSPTVTAPASPSQAPSPIRPTATGIHPVQPSSQEAAQAAQVQPASPKQKHTGQKLGLHKSGFSY